MTSARLRTLAVILLLPAPGLTGAGEQPPKKPEAPPPLEFRGHLTPVRRALVTSDTQGRVVELSVREGQQVRKGEVIGRLDRTQETLGARRAEARLAGAEARLAELRSGARDEEKALAQ